MAIENGSFCLARIETTDTTCLSDRSNGVRLEKRAAIQLGDHSRDRIIDTHDLVYGVWQDAASEYGVGFSIIKGEGKLEVIMHTNISQVVAWTAVECRCAEEAEAMCEVFGDKSKPV